MQNIDKVTLSTHLNHMIKTLKPAFRSINSVETGRHLLSKLGKNTRNVKKYQFIKALSQILKEEIKVSITGHLTIMLAICGDGMVEGGNIQLIINRTYDELLLTPEYLMLCNEMREVIRECKMEMMRSGDTDIGDIESEAGSASASRTSFISCLLNSMGLIFLNVDQFRQLSGDIKHGVTIEKRLSSLQTLKRVPVSDLCDPVIWPNIHAALIYILSEDDEELVDEAYRVCIALYMSKNIDLSRSIYTCLLQHLTNMLRNKSVEFIAKRGLQLSHPLAKNIMKGLVLISKFQQECPNIWNRHFHPHIDMMMEYTVDFLCDQFTIDRTRKVHGLDLLSVVDPTANWLRYWMKCTGNLYVMESLERHPQLVKLATQKCDAFVKNIYDKSPPYGSPSSSNVSDQNSLGSVVDVGKMRYLGGIHSHYILAHVYICQCKHQHIQLIPADGLHCQKFITALLHLLTSSPTGTSVGTAAAAKLSSPDLGHAGLAGAGGDARVAVRVCLECYRLLHAMCSDPHLIELVTQPGCLILHKLLQPLVAIRKAAAAAVIRTNPRANAFEQYIQANHDAAEILVYVFRILSDIIEHRAGLHALIRSDMEYSLADVIFSVSGEMSRVKVMSHSYVMVSYYKLLCRICGHVEASRYMVEYNIMSHIKHVMQQIKTTQRELKCSDSEEKMRHLNMSVNVEQTLLDELLSVALTAVGVQELYTHNLLSACVKHMNSKYIHRVLEHATYCYILSQIAATTYGIQILLESGYMSRLISDLWSALEESMDSDLQQYYMNILEVVTYSGVSLVEMVGEDADSAVSTINEDMLDIAPTSVHELMNKVLFIRSDDHLRSLYDYYNTHGLGLRWLNSLTSSLDASLLLNHRYAYQEFLLRCQDENRVGTSGAIIVDELSRQRNTILVNTYLVGGPSEKVQLHSEEWPQGGNDNQQPELEPQPYFSTLPLSADYIILPPPAVHRVTEEQSEGGDVTHDGSSAAPDESGAAAAEFFRNLSEFVAADPPATNVDAWLDEALMLSTRLICDHCDDCHPDIQRLVPTLIGKYVQHSTATSPQHPSPADADSSVSASLARMSLHHDHSSSDGAPVDGFTEQGILLVLRYASTLQLLPPHVSTSSEHLTQLVQSCRHVVSQHIATDCSRSFDWFLATAYLVFNCDTESCATFLLTHFIQQPAAPVLWLSLANAKCRDVMYCTVSSCVEMILVDEYYDIYQHLRRDSVALTQVCQLWLGQCMWNYADWCHVRFLFLLATAYPPDYLVYYLTGALTHQYHAYKRHHQQQQSFAAFIKERGIKGLRVGDCMRHILSMDSKHRAMVRPRVSALVQAVNGERTQ